MWIWSIQCRPKNQPLPSNSTIGAKTGLLQELGKLDLLKARITINQPRSWLNRGTNTPRHSVQAFTLVIIPANDSICTHTTVSTRSQSWKMRTTWVHVSLTKPWRTGRGVGKLSLPPRLGVCVHSAGFANWGFFLPHSRQLKVWLWLSTRRNNLWGYLRRKSEAAKIVKGWSSNFPI